MILSGLIVLCFVIFHVLHFTTHNIDPKYALLEDSRGRHDVYSMIIMGFSNPWVSCFYILAMFLLCSHLSHGFQSFFQTLGINSKKVSPLLSGGSRAAAAIIFFGYTAIPFAVLVHLLRLPAPR